MQLHPHASIILQKLQQCGYEAYIVGGCVRDILMGKQPHDWDITTSALPQQVQQCLSEFTIIPTGLQHGTLTVVLEGKPFEVTTYRTDGPYLDNRRPQYVTFTPSLRQDLARRDFTVNAMAYSPTTGLVDYFGGRQDIADKTLRSVGDPDERFAEDALRIMRALRFAAQLGFTAVPPLIQSIHKNKHLLHNIAVERITTELILLLCGNTARQVLLGYPDVLGIFMPEILPMVGFKQHNPHHIYDVWQHTALAVQSAPPNKALRLAMLLHDVGKPSHFSIGNDGIGHFYGHSHASEEVATTILHRLKVDNKTTGTVKQLIRWHDTVIEPQHLPRWLNRIGEERLRKLLQVKRADTLALAPAYHNRLAQFDALEAELDNLIAAQQCFSLKDLALNGNDIISAGVPAGPQVGKALQFLLNQVLEGTPNKRDILLEALHNYLK